MTLGNDNGTDGQTDRQSATHNAAPPREEGGIITAGNSVNKIKEYIITNRDWLKAVLSRQRQRQRARGRGEVD